MRGGAESRRWAERGSSSPSGTTTARRRRQAAEPCAMPADDRSDRWTEDHALIASRRDEDQPETFADRLGLGERSEQDGLEAADRRARDARIEATSPSWVLLTDAVDGTPTASASGAPTRDERRLDEAVRRRSGRGGDAAAPTRRQPRGSTPAARWKRSSVGARHADPGHRRGALQFDRQDALHSEAACTSRRRQRRRSRHRTSRPSSGSCQSQRPPRTRTASPSDIEGIGGETWRRAATSRSRSTTTGSSQVRELA